MSNCWKCQRELPDGQLECEHFCATGTGLRFPDSEEMDAAVAEFERNYVEVDWSKVSTLQDVIELLKFSAPVYIEKNRPEYQRLKKFTNPIRPES